MLNTIESVRHAGAVYYQRKPVAMLLIAILIGFTTWLGAKLTGGPGQIALIWIANGLLAGIILSSPRRDWIWLLASGYAGNVGLNFLVGVDPLLSVTLAFCNTIEVAAGCAITGAVGKFDDLGWGFHVRFLAGCVIIGPLLSAFFAALILAVTHGAPFLDVMRSWFAADAVGMASFAPLMLYMRKADLSGLFTWEGVLRWGTVLTAVALVAVMVFTQNMYNVRFLVTGVLVLTAFQLGRAGLSIAICMVALTAVLAIESYNGPLLAIDPAIRQKVLELQFYIVATVLTTFSVAITVEKSAKLKMLVDAANIELLELSLTDNLTKLSNRRAFDDALEREWKIATRNRSALSLLIIDVDRFKAYNDTYGHSAGDACLASVGRLLAGIVFRPSDLVARIGGEEFAAVLPGTSDAGAKEVAERIREAIYNANLPAESSTFGRVTVSVGVAAAIPAAHDTLKTLFDIADMRLYHAKQNGRNRVGGPEIEGLENVRFNPGFGLQERQRDRKNTAA